MTLFDLGDPHVDEPPQLVGHFQTMLCAHGFEAPVLRGLQINGQSFKRQRRRRTGGEVQLLAHCIHRLRELTDRDVMLMRFVV
ncbi:MAG TPA: hypothetical protein VGE92_07405 [Steroidobacteraceae bacterium]